jgi:signal transduction histidine kinase
MRKRWGLRAKMTASYVLVTAAAVVVVEVAVLVLVLPGLLSRPSEDAALIVALTARDYADTITRRSVGLGRLPTASEVQLGDPNLHLAPGEVRASPVGVRIPYTTTPLDDTRPMSLALLLTPDGKIVASSYPARYPVGGQIGGTGAGVGPLPEAALTKLLWGERGDGDERVGVKRGDGGKTKTANGPVLWAVAPVLPVAKPLVQAGTKPRPAAVPGFVYVQVPAGGRLPVPPKGSTPWDDLLPQLAVGLLALLVALPVGVVFGLLSTRSLIGRVRRLAASTVAVADGNYHGRVPVSGTDEVAQLETNFNRMAARLTGAMAAERHLAGATERARIARELHDSISQDLFSLRLLAGGLRRALPAGSPLGVQVEAMERTATGTMHEMQALLLELRPVALTDAGLVPALDELCQAYRDRLGVVIDSGLEPLELAPAIEHAVLRIVQEALANAVKHARPARIVLRMRRDGDQVEVSVTDDGTGFDPARAAGRHGMGLGLMRERVEELGGTFELDSAPGAGTTVRVRLPGRSP